MNLQDHHIHVVHRLPTGKKRYAVIVDKLNNRDEKSVAKLHNRDKKSDVMYQSKQKSKQGVDETTSGSRIKIYCIIT